MTDHTPASQAASTNQLSDEYVNAVIQRHGYDSPESVIAQLHQWIGLNGGENSVTLLMYEAHKALCKLRAPVASAEVMDALNWVDDFIARCNRDDRGSCDSVNVLRRALTSAPVAAEAVGRIVLFGGELKEVSWAAGKMPPPGTVLYAAPQASEAQHPDDAAVDRFAVAMKAKLAKKRAEGYGGWDLKDECSTEWLSSLLRQHLEKGDPVDVGNFAMMLHQRSERIIPYKDAPQASEAVRKQALAALESAQRFIRNGVEFGYVCMPDADTPDPAHRTPGLIDAAIRALSAQPGAQKGGSDA